MNGRRAVRLLFCVVSMTVVMFATAAGVMAAPPTTFTVVDKDVVETFRDDVGVCGVPGWVTITYNGVFHATEFSDGRIHFTGTSTGTVVYAGDNGVTYSGHFTQWFGEHVNTRNEVGTATFRVNMKGDDGSRLTMHLLGHFTLNANGEVTSEFSNERCH